jgi:hypothetical protein
VIGCRTRKESKSGRISTRGRPLPPDPNLQPHSAHSISILVGFRAGLPYNTLSHGVGRPRAGWLVSAIRSLIGAASAVCVSTQQILGEMISPRRRAHFRLPSDVT